MSDADATDDGFEDSVASAREKLEAPDLTAFYLGTVREGEYLDAASAYRGADGEAEGMQALSLLASHLRMVAEEADLEYATVARDAAELADRVEGE
jgi:hypothetical protein